MIPTIILEAAVTRAVTLLRDGAPRFTVSRLLTEAIRTADVVAEVIE